MHFLPIDSQSQTNMSFAKSLFYKLHHNWQFVSSSFDIQTAQQILKEKWVNRQLVG